MHVFEAWLHLFHPRRSNNHRPHLLHAESLFVLMAFAVSIVGLFSLTTKMLPGATGNVLGFATSITAEQAISETNIKRQELGLSPLTNNSGLAQAAQLKAADMFAHQYWAHTSPQGKEPWDFMRTAGYTYQAAGENLARDFSETDEMVDAWMNSPTHRANIVNPRFQEIGIAVVDGRFEGADTTLVVQMFGRPRTIAAAVTPASSDQREVVQSAIDVDSIVPSDQVLVATPEPAVLSAMSILSGAIRPWPVISPLQVTKAFFLSILVLLIATLLYDWALMRGSSKTRIVGHNLAHILFFVCILFLLITFHSGAIR